MSDQEERYILEEELAKLDERRVDILKRISELEPKSKPTGLESSKFKISMALSKLPLRTNSCVACRTVVSPLAKLTTGVIQMQAINKSLQRNFSAPLSRDKLFIEFTRN